MNCSPQKDVLAARPADLFLEKLDHQPVAGAEMIVLSEHVDYWNHIGWRDPYSAHLYSERQSVYGKRFGLDRVYTPQMVVDGSSEFVGSNPALADKAFAKALGICGRVNAALPNFSWISEKCQPRCSPTACASWNAKASSLARPSRHLRRRSGMASRRSGRSCVQHSSISSMSHSGSSE